MKSVVKKEQFKHEFPKLMMGISNPNCIVMFTSKDRGVIVSSDKHPLGHGNDVHTWFDIDEFKYFSGTVELKND